MIFFEDYEALIIYTSSHWGEEIENNEFKKFLSKRKALKWTNKKIAYLEKRGYKIRKISIKTELELEQY